MIDNGKGWIPPISRESRKLVILSKKISQFIESGGNVRDPSREKISYDNEGRAIIRCIDCTRKKDCPFADISIGSCSFRTYVKNDEITYDEKGDQTFRYFMKRENKYDIPKIVNKKNNAFSSRFNNYKGDK